mmetsp:Transcript_883/g.1377  ORF Transcript_883/g.1377 Transcript_883/m.1377 type:complete len:139 (+) Transcript_883:71-487(+)|eukprot:CAMPEP_0184646312 /NCGR_PEP_ID=MMETSP0308-20130426/2979_1 /TAXON_ID=38269 /ORGANISM="Gloeochaete witrockiana, Strain SAG 46.84" /LENGTH=138 /DNA_ID=CAMNT_0027076187 /DNA_START=29 /DNA_END=445 /DNA_ORIENTATION=-
MEVVAAQTTQSSSLGPLKKPIDREKVCPLLLRVFVKFGGHHRVEDYAIRGKEPDGEMQIYTWPDATLRELTELIKQVNREARRPTARLSFALVYPDKQGHNVLREIGHAHSTRKGEDDEKALGELHFQTGDFLDVAVF